MALFLAFGIEALIGIAIAIHGSVVEESEVFSSTP